MGLYIYIFIYLNFVSFWMVQEFYAERIGSIYSTVIDIIFFFNRLSKWLN